MNFPRNCPCSFSCSVVLLSCQDAIDHLDELKSRCDALHALVTTGKKEPPQSPLNGNNVAPCPYCNYFPQTSKQSDADRHIWTHYKGALCSDCQEDFSSGFLYIKHKCKGVVTRPSVKRKREEEVTEIGLKPNIKRKRLSKSSHSRVVTTEKQAADSRGGRIGMEEEAEKNFEIQSIWQKMMQQNQDM